MSRLPFAAIALAALVGVAAAKPAPSAGTSAAFEEAIGKILAQPGGLTADDAARRGAKASVAARRKAAELEEAQAGLSSISLALVPHTTVSAGYTRLSAVDLPPEFQSFGIEMPSNQYHFGAEVAIPLTDLFIRLPKLMKATEHGVAAAKTGVKAAVVAAETDARVAYYEWVRAELQVVVAGQLLAQVDANLGQIRNLAEVQRVSKADVLRLEAQRAQAELAVAQVNQLVALRAEQLRILIGLPPGTPMTIGEDVRVVGEATPPSDAETLLKTALDRRLELDAIDAASAALAQQRKAAKVDQLPKLSIFGQVNYDNPNQRNLFGGAEFQSSWAAGAQLTWSLNDFLDAKPHDRKYAAQQRALDADRAGLELAIRGELTAARQGVLLADASYQATQQGLVAAEESYRVRQELLAAERATAIELVDAEAELTRARIAAIDALIDRRIAWARLLHATGQDVQ